MFSRKSQQCLWRGELPSDGLDHYPVGQRSRQGPGLDAHRLPFSEKLVLPSLALSRKARAMTVRELELDGSARSGKCTPYRLNASQSLPSLLAGATPDLLSSACMADLIPRHPSSRLSKKSSVEGMAAESPVACTPCSDPTAAATPSTALESPAWPAAFTMVSPDGTVGTTPSSSGGFGISPSSVSRSHSKVLKWRQGEEIGSGSYGHVHMAQCKSTGHMFAVKVARILDDEEKFCEKLHQELDICKNLRHRNIVECLGHEFVNHRLYIYLEYVAGGSLRHMLNKFGPLEMPLLVKATRGMLKGLNYLHKRNPPVVHRDLKGANVLIDLKFCVKLADFGCSKCDAMSKSFSKVGSIHWVAPEVLQDAGHGRKGDIWSLGCVILEMATAADPWGVGAFDNIMQAMSVIALSQRTPPIPDALPESARDLVGTCLQRRPEDRCSASQLLQHPFVQSNITGERSTPTCCFTRPGSIK